MKRYAYLACVAASVAIMTGCGGSSGSSEAGGTSGGKGPGAQPKPVKHVFAASDGVNDVQ